MDMYRRYLPPMPPKGWLVRLHLSNWQKFNKIVQNKNGRNRSVFKYITLVEYTLLYVY